MPQTADVVIIGAGIVGSSIAYHLTEAGCKNVLVIERETRQGLGSTGKSMGGVRAQFATDVNIRMSMYAIPFLNRFEEATGYPSGYKPHGYLFMATNEKHMDYLRANYARQVALGLKGVELLAPADIAKVLPQMRSDDIIGGSFCATDGFVDPNSVMVGFMLHAMENGATLQRGTEVIGLHVENAEIAGVDTTNGPVATRTVVNAAGPWAAGVAAMAGADLPVEPLRRMLVPTEPFPGLPERLPMIIDMSTGWHFRQEGLGLLMAWADMSEQPGLRMDFDPAFIEKILTHAAARVPAFADLAVNPRRCWAGCYEMTPDHHSILGPSQHIRGLFFANGFSGHGVMHSPATGRIVSDLILRGETDIINARDLNVQRFAEGRAIEETAVL
ncbi:MAG TPA: FAD-dependent oxidoreductase [Bryobacteraceae bacterium]|nr:FAD-dependent oxidoreductase [Bryobacteraceae bacterium]